MDERFGVDLATQIRNRKLLDPELKRREVRAHPELPDNEDWVVVDFNVLLNIFDIASSISDQYLFRRSVLSCVSTFQELMQFLTLVEEAEEVESQEEIDRLYSCLDKDNSSSSGSCAPSEKGKQSKETKGDDKKEMFVMFVYYVHTLLVDLYFGELYEPGCFDCCKS